MRYYRFVFIALLSSLLFPQLASAHILKTDGSIGVVLHIDPNDDPVVGQPASFLFDITDTDGRFSGATCNCVVTITENSKQLVSEAATQTARNTLQFSYIFLEKGIYTITFTGAPVQAGAFQSFRVSYDWRIDQTSGSRSTNFTDFFRANLPYILFIGVGVVIAIYQVLPTRAKRS